MPAEGGRIKRWSVHVWGPWAWPALFCTRQGDLGRRARVQSGWRNASRWSRR